MSVAASYRPEIDGLRAIAVAAVILFHGQLAPLPGGFAGVDVFFVISGYLIGGLILDDLAAGRFSLLRFYERRVRRIVPALVVVLTATTVAMALLADPPQLLAYAQSLLSVVLMVSNLFFGAKSGYFAPALADAPLLHTWSLAVEEQFYLAFPPLLALLWRRGWVPGGLAVLALASLALAVWLWPRDPDLAYFFPLTRAWELLLGALAVVIERRWRLSGRPLLAALGLALILSALGLQTEASAYPALPALWPTLGAALVVVFSRADRGVGRVLASAPFVALGLVSYSAYLWHQPLFALARIVLTDPPGWTVRAGLAGLTLVLAWASWALVEQPFRRPRRRWLPDRRPLFAAAGLAGLALALVAGLGWASRGNDTLWRAGHPDQARMLDLILAAQASDGPPADMAPCRFNLTRIDAAARDRIARCAKTEGPAAVVLGDSHAIDLFNALAGLSPAPFLLGVTDGGCRPSDPAAKCAYAGFADLVAERPQDFAAILFVQAGSYLMRGPDGRPGSRQIFRRLGAQEPVPPLTPDAPAIARLSAYLAGLAAHVPVTVLAPRIEPQVPPNLVLRRGCATPYTLRPGLAQAFARLDQALAGALGATVTYIPLSAQGFDIATDFLTCDALYWSDGDHWSTAGERRFGARLLPLLPQAFR
jgi:peptidoglycan/LPS O-acetylase OafA/YrhL